METKVRFLFNNEEEREKFFGELDELHEEWEVI